MISKNKRTTTGNTQEVADNSARPDFFKIPLPMSYRRLLRLIFFSSNPLIHKASSNDKIPS
jgi:hypothetical protein